MEKLPAKRLLPLCILNLLNKYTDEDIRLTPTEIEKILTDEYGIDLERKLVAKTLREMAECDELCELGYATKTRSGKEVYIDPDSEKRNHGVIWTDWYLRREFTDVELRVLIDMVLFAGFIPDSQRKTLLEKLTTLGGPSFKQKVKHISFAPNRGNENKQLFANIEVLDEAIRKGKQVEFSYLEYGLDKKLHKRKHKNGKIRRYIVSPYQLAVREEKYYLICNYQWRNGISHFRMDRIADITILGKSIRPFALLEDAEKYTLDLRKYVQEHLTMYTGESVQAVFQITHPLIMDMIDVFGNDVSFREKTDTHVTVSAKVNERAMRDFAKRLAPDVTVLSPPGLANAIKEDLQKALSKYQQN